MFGHTAFQACIRSLIRAAAPGAGESVGKRRVKRQTSRLLAVALLAGGLAGCGVLSEGDLMDRNFWDASPLFVDNDQAELGLAEMAKGNYGTAELYFKKALTRNAKDVDALLGLGVLYQNTGQLTKAREMYEAILAIRPERSVRMSVWNNLSPEPVIDIASVNLALLESGGVPGGKAKAAGGETAQKFAAMTPPPAISQMPAGSALTGRMAPAGTAAGGVAPQDGSMGLSGLSVAADNVVSRFRTLTVLRDQGLITPDEFRTRRRASIGALLPLSSPPPATGLDRPVPGTEAISGRLRAIGRALEMRAISVSQHAAERTMILDALMPVVPISVVNPGRPPQGLLEAADAVRRLEQLKGGGYISPDEYAKERNAVERAMQPRAMPSPKAAGGPAGAIAVQPSGPQPAVHLASYRSQKAADRGWAQLRRVHRALLEGLNLEVAKVDLARKGIWYRLMAGPMKSSQAATELCRQLKSRRQFCEPGFMGAI